MENISLVAGESKIFGDELKQISGNSFIGKTGISLNLIDTATISIQAIISGQIVDSFFVNSYRVHVYNDKKTSFERIGEIITPVQMERSANAQSGYIINPGIYVRTGTNIINVVYPPSLS